MQSTLNFRTNRDLFSNHYLTEHLPETEQWQKVPDEDVESAFENVRELWESEQNLVSGYNEASLQNNFIDPVLEELGITFEIEETVERNARRPDYAFFADADARTAAFEHRDEGGDFYEEAIAVADAKRWGRKLDTRGEGERDFENPSYQIHVYLQETPAQWAVLTNGRKWRLYYGPTSHRLDSYYEINLPTLLEQGGVEEFRYFYLFFRRDAFVEDSGGDCFLDDVYDESNTFAEALGEDLQDNIYDAIGVLAEGFLEYNADLGEDDLDLIHDSSLIYLYRLIFVLYAESEGRELLPTDNDIYSESYSLNELKQTVAENLDDTQEHYYSFQTDLSENLDELFDLINKGSKSRDIDPDLLYIPAYDGGLFRTDPDEDDSNEANFLASHEVDDEHLAEVIDLLTRRSAENGAGKVFTDYSSLDIRHLGSIYEGLLEYQLNIADEPLTLDDGEYTTAEESDKVIVESGDVYMTTDSGERKATGSYYTPEYVVEYIVENTLGPLVSDIREDLMARSARGDRGFAEEFAQEVFDLKILDPAMGSGHFLTNAVDYLAREIINAQERQAEQQGVESIDQSHDINWARRQVAQRCIYGVDLNPLAVELSKVSLWLRTLAAEQPLAFLDHHLKTGNSLVGSDIEDVLSNGESDTDNGQLTLQQSFAQTRRQALEHVMDRFQDLLSIDNESLEDIKEMEAAFEEVRDDPLYQHLLAMANVHTAEEFGLDVPSDVYERMAEALRDDSWEDIEGQDWFESAQRMAEDEHFFHWELEFPVAFYDEGGTRRDSEGFDAVIGNPPYAQIPGETAERISGGGPNDLYAQFVLTASDKVRHQGLFALIVPTSWETGPAFDRIRALLLEGGHLRSLVNLPYDVFEDAYVDTSVFVWMKGNRPRECEVADMSGQRVDPATFLENAEFMSIPTERWNELGFVATDQTWLRIASSLDNSFFELGEVSESTRGVLMTDEALEDEGDVPILLDSFQRYESIEPDDRASWSLLKERPPEKDVFRGQRVLLRRLVSRSDRLMGTIATEFFVSKKDTYLFTSQSIDERHLLAILDSKFISWWHFNTELAASKDDFRQVTLSALRELPVPETVVEVAINTGNASKALEEFIEGSVSQQKLLQEYDQCDLLAIAPDALVSLNEKYAELNRSLLNYLGNYKEGPALPDVGLFQPTAAGILDTTTEKNENLRIGNVKTECDGSRVTIYATARYKPENEDEQETDRWGYTETDYNEAFALTNLSEEEAALVEAFVPVAVEEADGFAGFRDNATKNNSPIDRLKAITLPDPGDVADDLRRYVEVKERAEELDEKIEMTDQLIDQIVYDLYDLTDEEIEIVESAVQDD